MIALGPGRLYEVKRRVPPRNVRRHGKRKFVFTNKRFVGKVLHMEIGEAKPK